jgi:hypothetical protein
MGAAVMNTYFDLRPVNILIFVLVLIILLSASLFGQHVKYRNWSEGSAYILPEKRVELGLFQPLRYGQSKNIEWSIHPIYFFIIPNFNLKWFHGYYKDYAIATKHSIYYPTLLLRTISKQGTGGIISPEFDIPQMVGLNNEVLISTPVTSNFLITLKAGVAFGIKFGGLDKRTTIDLPFVYNRLAVFYHGYQLRTGIDLDGKIYNRWHFSLDGDYFYIPGVQHNKAFEHKGLIIWKKSGKTQIMLGYKLIYGQYPFGSQWHLFIPIFDLQKSWMRD